MTGLRSTLKWLDDYLEIGICVVLLIFMTSLIFVQVIMRYVFSNSLTWSEELARYVFIWLIYLGISYSCKEIKHIKIESALYLFPKSWRTVVTIVGDVLLTLFAVFIVYRGLGIVKFQSISRSAALNIPMSYIYSAPVVGFFLVIIRQTQTIVHRIANRAAGDNREKDAI
jgi:TRAP-type C4-dicarboxylate transport system permease small subunit